MRELRDPWTHFFLESDIGSAVLRSDFPDFLGGALAADYVQAKGDEEYGGVSGGTITRNDAFNLQQFVPQSQPVIFDGATIALERWPSGPNGQYPSTPQKSPTWYGAFDAFKRGEQLAPPYFAPRATDPAKQASLSAMYTRLRSGEIGIEDLTDLSDIYPDDPQTRAEIGLQTEPGATPAQMVVQACGPCHNDVLDQSISRARFNIALSRMDRAELDVAVNRLSMPLGSDGVMPPMTVSRRIDPSSLPRLVQYLQENVRSADDDALLNRAAQLGMSGGATVAPGANKGGLLTAGSVVSGQLAEGALDSYTFNAQAGEGVQLRVAATTSGSFTPKFNVYDPSGALLHMGRTESAVAGSDFPATASGTYTVVVFDGSNTLAQTGPYNLYFTVAPGANKGGLLTSGGVVSGQLAEGALDSYTFNAQTGQSVSLTLTASSGSFSPAFDVYDPTGAPAHQAGGLVNFGPATITFAAQTGGTFTVVVFDGSSTLAQTGPYTLSVTVQ